MKQIARLEIIEGLKLKKIKIENEIGWNCMILRIRINLQQIIKF
jgi:hypothetical protein